MDLRFEPLIYGPFCRPIDALLRFVSLKKADPLEDLRRLLIQQQQQPPPKKKNKGAQRKRALKRGKEKIKTAKQKALAADQVAAETKTSGDTPAKKASIQS